MERVQRVWWGLWAVAAVWGCGDDALPNYDGAPVAECRSADDAECASLAEYYFARYEGEALPECRPALASEPIDGQLYLRLFRGEQIGYKDVASQTRALQRYFERYGVTFFTDSVPAEGGMDYAITGDLDDLERALDEAGIPRGRALTREEQERADEVVANVLFANLKRFLKENSSRRQRGINVVVITAIADRATNELLLPGGGVIAGLGLSPALLDTIRADDAQADLYTLLDLDRDFTPTLFVGHDTLKLYDRRPDNIIAHELGHALGLPHTTAPGYLMTQGQDLIDCSGTLTDEELDRTVGIERRRSAVWASEPLTQLRARVRRLSAHLVERRASEPLRAR